MITGPTVAALEHGRPHPLLTDLSVPGVRAAKRSSTCSSAWVSGADRVELVVTEAIAGPRRR